MGKVLKPFWLKRASGRPDCPFDLLQRSAVGLKSWLVITDRLDSSEISS
ncbi:hypothetical protein SynMITS9220_03018 [Synechococcus sp. MIT S9220]|nr:hypothetical protein SynMITS9220_03018 [Synechococcus sp. MIT S9220]